MNKLIAQILAVTVLCSSLAIFWHATSMTQMMNDDGGMAVPCLTLCLTGGDPATSAVSLGLMSFGVILIIIQLAGIFSIGFSPEVIFCDGLFKKDRHRYLMKTAVMLR